MIPLTDGRVRGGRMEFELEAAPAAVEAMLLDFDAAGRHRAWISDSRTVRRHQDVVVTWWKFAGRAGFHPSANLVFRRAGHGDVIVLEFQLEEPVFGIARFSGEYRIRPGQPGPPPTTRVTAEVFISSGLPLVTVSHDEIAAGLREDARLLRLWMAERVGSEDAR